MKEKLAETENPVHELIRQRWSPRAFAGRAAAPEKILSLLEAARWAPSSMNEQPWSFLLGTKEQPEPFRKMVDCLMEGNQTWAKQAPALILSTARSSFVRNNQPNHFALHDLGLAVGNLLIQATALGLHAHLMGGYDPEKIRKSFHIPATHELGAVIALGYLGNPEDLPEELRRRETAPRSRKPLPDFVFYAEWGSPLEVGQGTA